MGRNKAVLLGLMFLLIFLMSFGNNTSAKVTALEESQMGSVLYVGGTEPGNYSKIQDAIDNASDGDTVFVYNDLSPYNEMIWINVSISLLGEDRDTTVIQGKEDRDIIRINKNNIIIQGFTLQGIDIHSSNTGIFIHADNIVISNTTIEDTSMGIYAISNYSSFIKNEFSSLGRGMWLLYSCYCQIADNTYGDNVYEDLTAGGSNCAITNNTFTGGYGLKIWKNNQTVVSNNTFLNSCIIEFYESYYNIVYRNTFEDGGFSPYKSHHNSVYNNTRNGVPIVYFDGAKDLLIDHAAQVILVQCEGITVRGITFADLPYGIYLENTNRSIITESSFSNCVKGISLYMDCCRNVVSNCQFNTCSWGITIQGSSHSNTLLNNTITDSPEAAILVDGSYNTISDNTISHATFGISLTTIHPFEQPSHTKSRRGNLVSFNSVHDAQYGILVGACFTDVKSNRITGCLLGIGVIDLALFSFETLPGNKIQGNSLENNQQGLVMVATVFTTIQKNNFISNGEQMSFKGVGLIGQIVGTRWSWNYWGHSTCVPKTIPGFLYIPTRYGDKISFTKIQWVEIDWFPAQHPYSVEK